MPTRWGQNWGRGISYRPDHSPGKPFKVKFMRNGRWLWLGSFTRLRAAQACSDAFLALHPPYKKRPATTEGHPPHGP